MKDQDIETVRERYSDRYRAHGYSPMTLGWGKNGRQEIRFQHLLEIGRLSDRSILDVGCGFGDLYGFLRERGWKGDYLGVDLVPDLIEEATRQYPDATFRVCDFEKHAFDRQYDIVIASGIFNFRLQGDDNYGHIFRMLSKMYAVSSVGVAVDFMSNWVDFQHPVAFHTDPAALVDIVKGISRRFVIRQDYMPYEFALYLYRDTTISEINTFEQQPELQNHERTCQRCQSQSL